MNQVAPSESLFLGSTRWIDVRAPVEFLEGAMPGALNLPLLNDEERHRVGTTYKQEGQPAAIRLGHELVGGVVREKRVLDWLSASRSSQTVIYCFRGGLRSQTVQSWLGERGVDRPVIQGGYKALRRFLSESLVESAARIQFQVLRGPTGSGKTAYLKKSGRPYLDLEALACHRGSAFGALSEPQPTQINFENALAVQLMHLREARGPVLVEGESRLIGKRYIPDALFAKMTASDDICLEVSLEDRVNLIVEEYVAQPLTLQSPMDRFEDLKRSVHSISRKLGGARTQEILSDMDLALADVVAGRGLDANRVWIAKLLEWYYDPRYKFSQDAHSRDV